LHAYSLLANEGIDDGSEIKVVLNEAPASNVFQIDGAEDIDVLYQPRITAEESAQGAVRSENIVDSYTVHHETKTNQRVGFIMVRRC